MHAGRRAYLARILNCWPCLCCFVWLFLVCETRLFCSFCLLANTYRNLLQKPVTVYICLLHPCIIRLYLLDCASCLQEGDTYAIVTVVMLSLLKTLLMFAADYHYCCTPVLESSTMIEPLRFVFFFFSLSVLFTTARP